METQRSDQTDSTEDIAKEWRPYEDRTPWSLDKARYSILPPAISKRRFFLPRLNLVGLTLFEALIALAILGGVIVVGVLQRTSEVSATGNVAQILWIPLFLFITYRSVITWLFGISFERGMFWHGFFALIATGYGIWHGVAAMYWADLDNDDRGAPIRGFDNFTKGKYEFEFITGACASLFMALLVVTSFHPFRRFARRVWLWSHHLFIIPAIVFSVVHGAPAVLAGFAIYLVDRLFGYIYQARFKYSSMGTDGKAEFLPSRLVRLSFPRLLSFQAGQYIVVSIPSVSIFEYHAFTIASAPTDEDLVVLIKEDGFWSRKLQRKVQTQSEKLATPVVPMKAFLHGPVGSVALDWQSSRYKAFVLVAGGIGITPMMTIYRHLAEQKRRGRPIHLARLIWTTRSRQLVDDCVSSQVRSRGHVVSQVASEEGSGVGGFEARIFLTRDGGENVQYPCVSGPTSPECEVLQRVEWNQGRPDIRQVFTQVKEEVVAENVGRVAVLACGPGGLTASVCKEAGRVSSGKARFDVHLEHFY